MPKPWFKAKDYGWGWQPAGAKGWLTLAAWVAVNIFAFLRIESIAASPEEALLNFLPFFFLSTLLLVAVAWRTGEKPAWRWGGREVSPDVVLRKTLFLILFIVIAEAVGVAGALITYDAIPSWYATLTLPPFAPPNWLFGPVWTFLYTLMGIAAFFVWDSPAGEKRSRALKAYWFQLALNAIWTPAFFGLKSPELGLIVIVLLLAAILVAIRNFARVHWSLALLLLPYLLWVAFATTLNAGIVLLN